MLITTLTFNRTLFRLSKIQSHTFNSFSCWFDSNYIRASFTNGFVQIPTRNPTSQTNYGLQSFKI